MELSYLKILQALVEDPHLSRTAERLHLTQSTLSKRVQAIEEEVGKPLFERRGPRGLKPFPHTLELAKVASRVLTTWESGVKKLNRSEGELEHFLLVGPPLFLREVVLPWWNEQAKNFPLLELEVKTSSLEKVSLETIQAGADAGILEHREELSDYVCKPMYEEVWGIVRHPATKHADLKHYKWGTYSSTRSNPVDTWLVQRNRMPVPSYAFYWEDLTALTIWVAENKGTATVLPWHAAAWMAKRGRVVFEPLGKDAVTQLYLAYPKESPHRELIRELLKFGSELEHSAFQG